MVKEVNEKYGKGKTKKRNEVKENPNETRVQAVTTKVDFKEEHSENDERGKAVDMDDPFYRYTMAKERFQNEFCNVAVTLRPIKYTK